MSLIRRASLTPFLWFNGQAEEAAQFYCSIFPDSAMGGTTRWGKGGRGPEGTAITVEFTLGGQPFTALNGGPQYTFTEAISFSIACQTQAEIDYYWDRLTSTGGTPSRCGWLKDRFGLSWQVVPANLGALISAPNNTAAVMAALMPMSKIELAPLEAAARRST